MFKAIGFIWPGTLTNHISTQYDAPFPSAHNILVNRAPESHSCFCCKRHRPWGSWMFAECVWINFMELKIFI